MIDKLTTFFGVTFILSMFFAAGAIDENNFFLGAMLVITGLLTGTLTAVLQK